MAYSQEAALSFALQDSTGVRTSLHVPVLWDPTRTVTQLAAAWNAQAALLDAVTGAKILYGEITILVKGAGVTFTPKSPTPIDPSDLEVNAVIDYPNVVSLAAFGSSIPAVQTAVLTSPGHAKLDEGNAAVIAYIAPFETPPTDWAATNNLYQRLATHTDSFLGKRKRRRQRRRVSKATP